MVNRHISPDLKECALNLWAKGWDLDDVCDIFSVSKASLYRWRELFDEFGSVTRPPSPLRGRPRILIRATLDAIHELYRSSPDLYLDEVVLWLAVHHDIVISLATLQRNLEDVGLT
ncbi:hypothetical protein BDN72DRAFT_737107, partial [Pluteus cervinus]